MRLHHLELSAFGPFRDRQRVDFDELGADGLFLLHGDTGAGKTTVLDAVTFALYGHVPGARDQAKALRCDTAPPETPTWVELELTVQGCRMRVRRNPEYERPKKTGSGTTREKPKASLTWLNEPPAGEPPEGITRPNDVGPTVERLLGLDVRQFCHVALLPQGDFARFLRADAKERADLLEKLFDTRQFSRIEQWFTELRRKRRDELDGARQHGEKLLARFCQVAGEEPGEEQDRAEWLDGVERSFARQYERARAEHERLSGQRQRADEALAAQRELADRVSRVRAARAELDELDSRAEEYRAAGAELDAARRAKPVDNAARELDSGVARLRAAERELHDALADCPEAEPGEAEGTDTETLRARSSRYRETAAVLADRAREAEQQRRDRERIAELDQSLAADLATDEDLAEQERRLPEAIEQALAAVREAERAPERLEAVTSRCDELDTALRAAGELPEAEARRAAARERAHRAVDEHQAAREHLQDVRERRLAGMAAELAAQLGEGTACPVCGSSRHPEPAEPHDSSVGAEEERTAREAEAECQRRRDREREYVAEAERECARLREQLGDRAEHQLREEFDRLTAEREALGELVEQQRARADRLAELRGRTEELGNRRAELDRRVNAARSTRESLAETVAERQQRLRAARGEFDTVAARRDHLLELAQRLERAVTARGEHDRASAHETERREALARVATENGFQTPEAALEARREQSRIDELAEWLRDVDRRDAAARATLRELPDVPPDTEVDVDGAAEAAERARRLAEEATGVLGDLDRRSAQLAELGRELRQSWKELEPAEREFAELHALTDVINGQGQNARRMTLRSYVLAARLEEVAEAATARLRHMSDGRYAFVHSDEQGTHGKRGGLDLRVVDDYSGRTRSTRTLSGGESFLASLSLALGLADVVSAEAGGAMLDTLFIDEGFGTLDGDTLDLVMDALDELRAGGRMVGLVSHVDELRQRVPIRLRVRKSRGGSSLAIES
ncbi:exonuclease SbcC [Actinopolyspora erythraea]|uniref:Nuclease SbcCD subunit C n=1 Tax=Actinopolyspora erythraea TaxID=414996 RepID=A0A099D0S4_9ACTN|nr:SMC family ATPase [Actinopolyspora erythraea]ASU79860.1 exonuclease SbcC [Actinopolyspora erythraea]KGI79624.1 exonuclease SbcC [Actinopolyspora erythraea]